MRMLLAGFLINFVSFSCCFGCHCQGNKDPVSPKVSALQRQLDEVRKQIDALRKVEAKLMRDLEDAEAEQRDARFPGIRNPEFKGYVYSLAFSRDGKTLAIGSAGKGIFLW